MMVFNKGKGWVTVMPPCSLVPWRWRCVYVVFNKGKGWVTVMPPCSLVAWRWRCVDVMFRRGRLTSLSHAKMAVVCSFPNMAMLVVCQRCLPSVPFQIRRRRGRLTSLSHAKMAVVVCPFPNMVMLDVGWSVLVACQRWLPSDRFQIRRFCM